MNLLIIKNIDEQSHFLRFNEGHVEKIRKTYPDIHVSIVNNEKTEISQKLIDSDVILADDLSKVDISLAKHIKWIHVTWAGVDQLPKKIKHSSVLLTNSSGVHPIPIAEHVLAVMLMFSRQIDRAFRDQIIEKRWVKNNQLFSPSELYGATVAIIGLGRIGERFAELAKNLGMKVFALVRNTNRKEKYVDKLFTFDNLDELLSSSDYVVNILPATEETYHMFNYETLKMMKKTAYFINVGRGKTVNEEDLIKILKEKKIAGAALDVFEEEPLPQSSPLWNLDNVILTPHISGWTPYYMDRAIDIFCENLKAYLKDAPMPTLVDKKRGY